MNYFGFIYKWTDLTNGKTYIGSHKGSIEDNYDGSGKLFLRAFKKRSNKFNREILEYVYEDNREILLEREQKYLDLIDWNNTYNLSAGARGGNTRAGYTKDQLKKTNQKISRGNKGKKRTEEQKRRNSESNKGRIAWNKGIPQPKEIKQKISKKLKGNKNASGYEHTKQDKQKQSERMKGNQCGKGNKGKIPWNKGISCTEERKKNISESLRGRKLSESHKQAISNSLKRKKKKENAA